ncbi:MAG TPA: hypothetical protein VFI70_02075, partial [Nitrososphaeraceae archaeon]|nr:hypothetical protein [Nitrososphaeraceae archaeon]
RTMYDPYHDVYMWIRLGKPYSEGQITNILRLAISRDTINWVDYDFTPIHIFNDRDIIDAQFDYPEAILSKNYLYLTSSVVVGQNCEKEYGAILRIPLDNLSNALNNPYSVIPYYAVLDRNVTAIAPVDAGNSTSVYFGAHLKDNASMKIYEWKEGLNSMTNQTVSVAPWNNIHNSEFCGLNPSNSEKWWCKANTNTRIRSTWFYNDSLNFMWNSIISYDNGSTWKPYIDVATFDINRNMSYQRKYYVADDSRPWIFGAAIPNDRGDLGIIAYYVTSNNMDPNVNPYLNLAFGTFNQTTNKWDMKPLVNSSEALPVKNEEMKHDYNFGDFITIRKHPLDKNGYLWDAGAYVIVGNKYDDVDPYFIMIKR